jgi:hypothetical protein
MCAACGPALAGIIAPPSQQGSAGEWVVVEPVRAADLFRVQAVQQILYAGRGPGVRNDDFFRPSVSAEGLGAGEDDGQAGGGMTFGQGLYADLEYAADVVRCLRQVLGNRTMCAARMIAGQHIALN